MKWRKQKEKNKTGNEDISNNLVQFQYFSYFNGKFYDTQTVIIEYFQYKMKQKKNHICIL